MNRILIPSLLSADFSNPEKQIRELAKAGAEQIHFDVMDGHFVPNITFGPIVLKSLKKIVPAIKYDVHLMTENPEKFIKPFVMAGADTIIFHIEACNNIRRLCYLIKKMKKRVGLSLNPKTPVGNVFPYLEDFDQILVMTVNPGFGGQEFIPATLKKIALLRKKIEEENLNVDIEVDGGINKSTIGKVIKADANFIVAGNAVFSSEFGVAKGYKKLRKYVDKQAAKI